MKKSTLLAIIVFALLAGVALTTSAQSIPTTTIHLPDTGNVWGALTSLRWPEQGGQQVIYLGNTKTIVTRQGSGVNVAVFTPDGGVKELLGITNPIRSRALTYRTWQAYK